MFATRIALLWKQILVGRMVVEAWTAADTI